MKTTQGDCLSKIKMTLICCLWPALAIVSLTGCVSMSGLQTARTLPPGESQATFGGGVYSSDSLVKSQEDQVQLEKISLPYLEASYRRGFGEKWDAGVKVALIGTLNADMKYSLFAGEQWAFAVGAGLGYIDYESSSGLDTQKYKVTIIDIHLPLYASYDFSDRFAVYMIPKYILRTMSGDSSDSASLAGGTLGLKVGNRWGMYLEGSQIFDLSSNFSLSQGNASIFWQL